MAVEQKTINLQLLKLLSAGHFDILEFPQANWLGGVMPELSEAPSLKILIRSLCLGYGRNRRTTGPS
jgi:hypothetical protein